MKKHIASILIILVSVYCMVKPLAGDSYFTMHDDTQVSRVIVMGNALRNGQFPVRWVSDLGYGYGYPLFNFYGPLPYYVGGGLYAAGIDAVTATKFMMGLGMVLSAIFMYAFVRTVFGHAAAIFAAVLYAYAPYHAVELYVRGAVGELWSYAMLPIVFLGIYLCKEEAGRKHALWVGGLGLAGIILSHTIMGYIAVAFYAIGLTCYAIYLFITSGMVGRRIMDLFLIALIGLGFSAFFWLPVLVESGYTNVAGQIGASANFRDHFVCVAQLWNSVWGFGGSASGCVDGMSFKIGKLHVLLAVAGLALSVIRFKQDYRHQFMVMIGIMGLIMVGMTTKFFAGVWEVVPGFAYIQYPWRFLTGIVFACSVLGGSFASRVFRGRLRLIFFGVSMFAVVFINAKLFVPQRTYYQPAQYFERREDLSWRVSKISDEYLPGAFIKPSRQQDTATAILKTDANRGLFSETELDTETYAKLHIQSDRESEVVLNRVYFPGWSYLVNGTVQPLHIVGGMPIVRVPSGGSAVELRFGNTAARSVGNFISLLAVLFFLRKYGKKSLA